VMNDSAPAPGWWKASDGIWHPPSERPSKVDHQVGDAAPAAGWEKGADGLWHPPPEAGAVPAARRPAPPTRPETVSANNAGTSAPPSSASGRSSRTAPIPTVGSSTGRAGSTPTAYATGSAASSSGLSTTALAWMVVGAVALIIVIALAAAGSSSTNSTNNAATSGQQDEGTAAAGAPADPQPEPAPPSGGAQQPGDLGGDEFMDGLAESCFGGALSDCDYLYRVSAVGSDYEAYAATCGGRDLDATNPGGCEPPSDIEVEPPSAPSQQPPVTEREWRGFCAYIDPLNQMLSQAVGTFTAEECRIQYGGWLSPGPPF